ncbi:MAG: tRNA (N6-threonylcarbamoyladenosine(37)-N6)-methyltransferase TrmO [Deltaproteobacteria bacterium]|nr:tRNA (N6-threonylcarbamoyladenosine(37)-N6)-methyltransferase TrmO [Deltaproteobacteria bacterium]
MSAPEGPFTVVPIGVVRAPWSARRSAPRQPGAWDGDLEGTIELIPGRNLEQALHDLDGFDRVWVLSWFPGNDRWRPKVLPPRGPAVRRGVFATRSPHRPNPLGLSLVRLLGVRGLVLRVAGLDLLDGTPVLDLKPYLAPVESVPDARLGWLSAVEGGGLPYEVRWSAQATAQQAFLSDLGVLLAAAVARVLAQDPLPGRHYRRVERHPEGGYQLALGSWRVRYTVEGAVVDIVCIASGYAPSAVGEAPEGTLEDDLAHRAFHARWPW